MERLSIFGGKGFIGSRFVELYPHVSTVEERDANKAVEKNALYFISTTTNYHVFDDVHLDIDTNLNKLMYVLPNINGDFNFTSSWFTYGKGVGDSAENAAREDSVCNPNGFYSITKRTAEQLTKSYCETFRKSYRILRLCNIVGGDCSANAKKNALEFLIKKVKRGEDVQIYDGDNYRNFLHVDDACHAIKLVTDKGNRNEIYNIGSTHSHRIIDIVEYAIHQINSKSKIILVKTPAFHDVVQTKDFFMNCNKLRGLGFVEQYDIYDCVNKMLFT